MRPLILPLALVPTSCVVASTPVFQEIDDCPPSFLLNEAVPAVKRIFKIDTTANPFQFDASVPLRSCATAKQYKGRVFIDNHLYGEIGIDANGDPTRKPTAVLVPLTGSSPGCHVIELLASTDYAPDTTFRTPLKQGDLASIAWFIDIEQPGAPAHTLEGSACE